ncbi:MAG TPA: MFS transporter [Stellaceae bacterium]|jgi:MFS family permease|nr:MFS transporter [Stellaceae bacterium]
MTTQARATIGTATTDGVESAYAWRRLLAALLLSAIGGIGLWSAIVVLPAVQIEFGVDRGSASLPYTATMMGFAFGGIFMGRLADRRGVVVPVVGGAFMLSIGYVASAYVSSLWQFAAVQGLFIGMLGSSATFGPLVADVSHWFTRNRGIAVGICASGNYLAGTVWPPVLQHFIDAIGWRQTHIWIGIFCAATMLPLSLALRRPTPISHDTTAHRTATTSTSALPVAPNTLLTLLTVAGFACCVAMSMPQVHIVAYCGDLGYGVARGAEMLSLMLGLGMVSRLASGWISDHIGGVRTLVLGSALQMLTLLFYVPFDGLTSLYLVSALFGLSQGGIVPSYAMIIREYFPPQEAGARFGTVLMATIVGMAAGGWMSGEIFDLTGSYQAAFLNGIAWNVLNLAIALWLLRQPRGRIVHA